MRGHFVCSILRLPSERPRQVRQLLRAIMAKELAALCRPATLARTRGGSNDAFDYDKRGFRNLTWIAHRSEAKSRMSADDKWLRRQGRKHPSFCQPPWPSLRVLRFPRAALRG